MLGERRSRVESHSPGIYMYVYTYIPGERRPGSEPVVSLLARCQLARSLPRFLLGLVVDVAPPVAQARRPCTRHDVSPEVVTVR